MSRRLVDFLGLEWDYACCSSAHEVRRALARLRERPRRRARGDRINLIGSCGVSQATDIKGGLMRRHMVPLIALVGLVAACGKEAPTRTHPSPSAPPVAGVKTAKQPPAHRVVVAAALERFPDCAAVTKSLRTDALRYVGPYGLQGFGAYATVERMGAALAESGAAQTADAKAMTAGVDYSTTNVQEEGVDEPDVIDTDGRRVFMISGQKLRAAVIEDGRPRLASSLAVASADAQMMLAGDKLVVVGNESVNEVPTPQPQRGVAMSVPMAYAERTLIQVIDVSDPSAMRVLSTLHFDGTYVSARSVGGVARIVVRRSAPAIAFAQPTDGSSATIERATAINRDAIKVAGVDKWIPRFTLKTSRGTSSGALSSCATTYHPRSFSGLSTVTVVTVDPSDPTPRNGSTVVGGGEIVYASHDAMYVTAQKWPDPRPLVASKAAATDIAGPAVGFPTTETQIHKFDIKGTSARYIASGLVKGTLLNQFAMSEFDGNLRVASTRHSSGPTGASSDSAVTVLEQQGEALNPIGTVGGLGRGEEIRAVRFIGAAAYVVTFRQIDPLYVIDLRNPSAPKVAGELKIPGFSAYLHPIGDDLLLGIGEQANAKGEVHDPQGHWFGTKISLFDVHDPSRPSELANHVIPGGQSLAEGEHHAFLWWGPRKLAVLPITSWESNSFRGAVGLRVERSLKEVGRIADPEASSPDMYGQGIVRAAVVGDLLLTLSPNGLRASDIESFVQRAWLPFGS